MPYTATVGLALTSSANTKLKAFIDKQPKPTALKTKGMFRNADVHKTKQSSQLFYWNCLEWGHDSAPCICLEAFLKTIPATDYHLCLVGDDPHDNQDRGLFNDPWDMLLLREVVFD